MPLDRLKARPARPAAGSATGFTPQTLAFLRALARNNRREWFHERKDRYEEVVRAPMAALIERFAVDFRDFAPDMVATPRASMYRIYRDTRFSADKTPLKTHVAAVFPHRLLPKHEGAGLYLEVAAQHVWYGGGMYLPSTSQLHLVREHIAAHHRRLRSIVESPAFRRVFGELGGEQLKRVPLGFPKDHPAAEYLKFRQFLAGCEAPAAFATSPRFYRTVLSAFRVLAPLIAFLDEPLIADPGRGSHPSTWLSSERSRA
ncbi:MAG: DUF2461 domain-containing protein [Acidobacteria bacterium]|nr:DUF2461 domain-containing protein [Acidobacteriota bacterium]